MSRGYETSSTPSPPLQGILAEFRTALQSEIEAAKRLGSSTAVPLLNGRRIARVGGASQYIFDIETTLNVPADTPADLCIPDRSPLPVTIVSIDGLSITLSAPVDLGPYVPSARLTTDLTYLMRTLIERIEALSGKPNLAGERVRGASPASGKPEPVDRLDLNPKQAQDLYKEQKEAVAASLGQDTTFIWGPPGTGKSYTIGVIAHQLYLRGRSVLLVSHTNNAVDEALLCASSVLEAKELDTGRILRVGHPKNEQLKKREELLLETHVDRKSKELRQRKNCLEQERSAAIAEVNRVSRNIDICEWVSEADEDIAAMVRNQEELTRLETELEQARDKESQLARRSEFWLAAAEEARDAERRTQQMATLEEEVYDLSRRLSGLQSQFNTAAQRFSEARGVLAIAERIAPLRARARELPDPIWQTQRANRARTELANCNEAERQLRTRLEEAQNVYLKTSAVGRLVRLWRRLPSPEEQLQVVRGLQDEVDAAVRKRDSADALLLQEETILKEATELAEQLREHRDTPGAEAQRSVVRRHRDHVATVMSELDQTRRTLEARQAAQAEIEAYLRSFRERYSAHPDQVLSQASAHSAELQIARSLALQLAQDSAARRRELERLLSTRLGALREWKLTEATAGSPEAMLAAIREAHKRAAAMVEPFDLNALRDQRARLNGQIRLLERQIEEIEEALKRVEALLISEAAIVATTLTQAYRRDDIQSRRFDTVILDEASMAPIPSLWVAASLSDSNVVVVGDFEQLPPIVLSKDELAKNWLGRDIFEVAGLSGISAAPPWRKDLKEQHRMDPAISNIPNSLIYHGMLRDAESTKADNADDELLKWYRQDWGHDHRVLLVDTGSVDAWVTSVPRGKGASRLNFLSATICVDLAEQILRPIRDPCPDDAPPRIMIISPYRPHAEFVQLLLREHRLSPEIIAGTAHSFQGSEADVVILDLVNDEPHWRVGMFVEANDKTSRRLLNVALTRAKRRLIVVGDFAYISKKGKNAFIGRELIPFLQQHYPSVDALEVVKAGLTARAAKAQALAFGGQMEADAPAIRGVARQDFDRLFFRDLELAKKRVVIFATLITANRLELLALPLRAATQETGVRVYVVTRALTDRTKSELPQYDFLESKLAAWGINVIHKRGMHEKLIFVDEDIIWTDSLNPLSVRDTGETFERRKSRKVFEDYARLMRLEDLLNQCDPAYRTCPCCGSEVAASEGPRQPFYWRCEKCHYKREIDDPRPEGGIFRCKTCGAPVAYGSWGPKPAWRCLDNRPHHQRILRCHLLVPKMRALIPKVELQGLDRLFNLTPQEIRRTQDNGQISLPFGPE